MYTDVSKDGCNVGSDVCFENHFISRIRLPDDASIFTAEAQAIDYALLYISLNPKDKFVFLSDSLSISKSIKNKKR